MVCPSELNDLNDRTDTEVYGSDQGEDFQKDLDAMMVDNMVDASKEDEEDLEQA